MILKDIDRMTTRIPSHFDNSPLFEAIFEVRFLPEFSFASKLLGFFLPNIMKMHDGSIPPFQPQDGLNFPKELKDQDKNLYYLPSFKFVLEDISVTISDGSVTISQDKFYFPYQGWSIFRLHIAKTMDVLLQAIEFSKIERFSLKYVDILEHKVVEDGLAFLNFKAHLGQTDLSKTIFNLQFEQKIESDIVVVTQLAPSVTMDIQQNALSVFKKATTPPSSKLKGLLLTTDTICFFPRTVEAYRDEGIDILFDKRLDHLHTISKEKFMHSFTEQALESLGVHYE